VDDLKENILSEKVNVKNYYSVLYVSSSNYKYGLQLCSEIKDTYQKYNFVFKINKLYM